MRIAVEELKNGKTPGEDHIHNEYLKVGLEQLQKPLTEMFNRILQTEDLPSQWKTSKIILLHKKGAKDELNNYRPISLISNLYKVFSKIITRRITKTLDQNQPNEQAGFRTGFSTIDHLQAVKQIIEKSEEYNLPLYLAFVDYKKAFDTVEHSRVIQALTKQGVEPKYSRILRKLYNETYAKVTTEREGDEFKIERGVRQGDPISPKLFTSLLEDIFQELDWESKYGIKLNGFRLTNLRFADDVVLFARNAQDLQTMIQNLNSCSKKAGLEMNMNKTQVMTNSQPTAIKVESAELQYVEDYTYLGQLIGFKNNMDKELKRRIALAWKTFWTLKFILLDKKLNRKIKIKALESCVFPSLLYGCQTWNLTEKQKKDLQTCQRKMERKILGLSLKDRVPNTRIREITKLGDVAQRASRLKWKWGGHVARLQNTRWAYLSTVWSPRLGQRHRGRPGTRWADVFKKVAGVHWTRIAGNRNEWRHLGDTSNTRTRNHQYHPATIDVQQGQAVNQ